jgi:hypothetical protein
LEAENLDADSPGMIKGMELSHMNTGIEEYRRRCLEPIGRMENSHTERMLAEY